jgi:hypothetical protein
MKAKKVRRDKLKEKLQTRAATKVQEPEVRLDERLVRRMLIGFGLGLLGLISIVVFNRLGTFDTSPGVSLIAYLLMISSPICLLWYRYLANNYTCPQCRARLPRIAEPAVTKQVAEGDEIVTITEPPFVRYFCSACNLIWDTGLKDRNASST